MKFPVYFCADIETSGQNFVSGSMMTIGMVPVFENNGVFARHGRGFYTRLMSDGRADGSTMEWWDKQDKSLFDEAFKNEPRSSPYVAMMSLDSWIKDVVRGIQGPMTKREVEPILVAAPSYFDGNFIKCYFAKYCKNDPFGHNRCIDMKSYVMGLTGMPHDQVSRSYMKEVFPVKKVDDTFPEHHALGDAMRLADQWVVILNENRRRTG